MFDLRTLDGTLVVSCQAPPGSPLRRPEIMAVMAQAAVRGGAAAIRANGADDVAAVRAAVDVPVIGLNKRLDRHGAVWITPTLDDALPLIEVGADVVALDATLRSRSDGEDPRALIEALACRDIAVLADIDEPAAASRAHEAGAAAVATTLAGYTDARPGDGGPDIALVAELARRLTCPILAEGRYRSPEQVAAALAAGATAVVVGTAITEPIELTRRLAAGLTPPRGDTGPRR